MTSDNDEIDGYDIFEVYTHNKSNLIVENNITAQERLIYFLEKSLMTGRVDIDAGLVKKVNSFVNSKIKIEKSRMDEMMYVRPQVKGITFDY